MLRSAIDLQSRLYNIHRQNFLNYFYGKSQPAQEYAMNNTLFVIAEYLGWVEILRKEIQFLDLGDPKLNRKLTELLFSINHAFSSGRTKGFFKLYNGEQRAIGEIMTFAQSSNTGSSEYGCIGYATFVKKMNDPDFSAWFVKLRNDIEIIGNKSDEDLSRLSLIHNKLIDLIDFLDPEYIVLPLKYRRRIEEES